MRRKGCLIWAAVVLAVAAWVPSVVAEIDPAPSFFLSNLKGERFISRQVTDPMVLSFFFVDCIACRKEMPVLYRYLQSKQTHARLLFVDPLSSDTTQRIKRLAENLSIPESFFYHDILGAIGRKFGVNNRFPTIIGIRRGRIVFRLYDISERSLALIHEKLN